MTIGNGISDTHLYPTRYRKACFRWKNRKPLSIGNGVSYAQLYSGPHRKQSFRWRFLYGNVSKSKFPSNNCLRGWTSETAFPIHICIILVIRNPVSDGRFIGIAVSDDRFSWEFHRKWLFRRKYMNKKCDWKARFEWPYLRVVRWDRLGISILWET